MQVYDNDGNLTWDSDTVNDANPEITKKISDILRSLLSEVTIKMATTLDTDTTSLVYTKEQIDKKFLENLQGYLRASDLSSTVRDLVSGYVESMLGDGSSYDIGTLRNYTLQIYKLLYGRDFDGNEAVDVVSYALLISNLQSLTSGHTASINNMNNMLYLQEGTQTQVRRVPFLSETGYVKDLSVNAGKSDTQYKTIVQVVNELYSSINTFNTNVNGVSNKVDTLSSGVSSVNTSIGNLKNLSTSNKSDLVGAINELFQYCSNLKQRVASAITAKGVSTDANASIDTIVANIGKIGNGVSS